MSVLSSTLSELRLDNRLDIFGEDHSLSERKRIEKRIKRLHAIKPLDYLLLEGIGPNKFLTVDAMKKGLKDEQYSLGPRDIEFGIELNIPIIGIDLWKDSVFTDDIKDSNGDAVDLTRSFRLREANMINIISQYHAKGRCAVIIGDTHLRTVKTDELGPASPIVNKWKNDKVVFIHRSSKPEID